MVGFWITAYLLKLTHCAESFFLNHLEFVYGATLFMTMATALFPKESEGHWYRVQAHSILDVMITRGNRVAQSRKEELLYMEYLFDEFSQHLNQGGLEALVLFQTEGEAPYIHGNEDEQQNRSIQHPGNLSLSTTEPMQHHTVPVETESSADMDLLSSMGISSFDFYSIADEMVPFDDYNFMSTL